MNGKNRPDVSNPDACDLLAEALKQMDNLLSDTSDATSSQNSHQSLKNSLLQNGHHNRVEIQNGHLPFDGHHPFQNGRSLSNETNASSTSSTFPSKRSQLNIIVRLSVDLQTALGKVEGDHALVFRQLPMETRSFLQHWISEATMEYEKDHQKLELVVENSRLRLRLARMEREMHSVEDKFVSAQRRISELQSCLNERTIEVTGLTSRLARTAHFSPERNPNDVEKLKRVVELLKVTNEEKNFCIEELRRTLNKYKKMEGALFQLKQSQILDHLELSANKDEEEEEEEDEEEWRRSSGEEDVDGKASKNTNAKSSKIQHLLDGCHAVQEERPHYIKVTSPTSHQLRSISNPRLTSMNHAAVSASSSFPLSTNSKMMTDSSSYDNLVSYSTKTLPLSVAQANFTSRETLSSNANLSESPTSPAPLTSSPTSSSDKRPPLPPHSVSGASSGGGQGGVVVATRRQNHRVFGSLGKGILKCQGKRWSRSTPSLVKSNAVDLEKKEKEEGGVGGATAVDEILVSEDKDKDETKVESETESKTELESKMESNTELKMKKNVEPKGFKRFFGRMKRSSSQELNDEKLEDFKRSGLRSTVGARLGWSPDVTYDSSVPFARWDTDRVALWLHVLGLSMYIGNCRRWVKNGEHLLQATNHDLEKELEIRNHFHRKKLQLALQAVLSETNTSAGNLDHNWVARWLDDVGLPQYKDQFYDARVDGRILNHLTVDELISLKVTNAFHHVSFKRAIQMLRMKDFNQTCLVRRPSSIDEVLKNCPNEVMLWTNHRVMEWLRSIDLSEYAPNLRGSGVHGAVMVLESCFSADVFASILSIPSSKTLLRRHLTTHFVSLVGNVAQQQKKEMELLPGYTALMPNKKIKVKRSIFKSEKMKEEFVCPIEICENLQI